jgi:hypothetical protein
MQANFTKTNKGELQQIKYLFFCVAGVETSELLGVYVMNYN